MLFIPWHSTGDQRFGYQGSQTRRAAADVNHICALRLLRVTQSKGYGKEDCKDMPFSFLVLEGLTSSHKHALWMQKQTFIRGTNPLVVLRECNN